jgi:hypothetical protein
VAYLDRVNVGFAKLSMLGDLGLSEARGRPYRLRGLPGQPGGHAGLHRDRGGRQPQRHCAVLGPSRRVLPRRDGGRGLAIINSLRALGGFFGPYLLGVFTDAFGSTRYGLIVLGLCTRGAGRAAAARVEAVP